MDSSTLKKDAPSLITIGLGQLRGLVQDVLSRLSHDQAHDCVPVMYV